MCQKNIRSKIHKEMEMNKDTYKSIVEVKWNTKIYN